MVTSTVQYNPGSHRDDIQAVWMLIAWQSLSFVLQIPVTSVLCQGSEVMRLQWKHMKGAVWWEHKVYYLWRVIDGRCEMTSCR